jgi:hypothetical protein
LIRIGTFLGEEVVVSFYSKSSNLIGGDADPQKMNNSPVLDLSQFRLTANLDTIKEEKK